MAPVLVTMGRTRIRVRRRGRLLLALLLAVLSVLVMPLIFPARAHDGDAATVTVVVRPGDTLWELARTYGPQDADTRLTVHRIRQLNGLATAAIRPGQRLQIPTR
nr:hypothetical protein [Bacillota bacterium]